ncbi:hypothetical protein AAFF_G00131260 [Aldrovandia affinis]|uniref:Uncharacterized protein n=1 Tax=Aldrovandia affinis TaxID=143900 RepID=A0AAD7RR67_9TELE|nr:hypothetical protein AAFF_G00131260 [Aldrovandia affinis]
MGGTWDLGGIGPAVSVAPAVRAHMGGAQVGLGGSGVLRQVKTVREPDTCRQPALASGQWVIEIIMGSSATALLTQERTPLAVCFFSSFVRLDPLFLAPALAEVMQLSASCQSAAGW